MLREKVGVIYGNPEVTTGGRALKFYASVRAMRGVPIFTFINKMDREARDPYELLEDIENELGIGTYAVNLADRLGQALQGRVRPHGR